ncbi:MAG: metallophosphoesterase family protein [Chloroflexota bacterium]
MLIAVMADIHGNLAALEAVWQDIQQHQPDIIVHAGDLVGKGLNPAECVDWLQANDVPNIFGNTDLAVLAGEGPVEHWNKIRLSQSNLDYLSALPITQKISPQGKSSAASDLLIMHSSPRSCRDLLVLEPHPASHSVGFQKPTSEEKVIQMLQNERANLMIYGHIHYQSARTVVGQRIASVGSVGFPYDADHRAAYALAQWDSAYAATHPSSRKV